MHVYTTIEFRNSTAVVFMSLVIAYHGKPTERQNFPKRMDNIRECS